MITQNFQRSNVLNHISDTQENASSEYYFGTDGWNDEMMNLDIFFPSLSDSGNVVMKAYKLPPFKVYLFIEGVISMSEMLKYSHLTEEEKSDLFYDSMHINPNFHIELPELAYFFGLC